MKTTIVATTVQIPHAMRQIADNARHYGHKDLDFIVVGDRKTPSSVADFCARIRRDFYPAEYLDMDAQSRFLAPKSQALLKHLCFDSRQRRNVGIFRAWQNGADIVLSIDPHIEIGQEDFLSPHLQTGKTLPLVTRSSPTGWHNIAEDLVEAKSQPFFLRGFPQWQRENLAPAFRATESVNVAAHSGFLLGASDLDAATRIDHSISAMSRRSAGSFALARGTWSPVSAHNVSFKRDLIPACFFSPYVGRYDDIWASYVITRIAHHIGDVIAFGDPCVYKPTNSRDLARDFDHERTGFRQTDNFCAALRAIPLTGTTYHECFGQIAAALPGAWPETPRACGVEIEGRKQFLAGLAIWHELFDAERASGTANLFNRIAAESPKPTPILPALETVLRQNT